MSFGACTTVIANLIIPVLFVVAGVAMFYNEFHKKPRKHVEDVKKYL